MPLTQPNLPHSVIPRLITPNRISDFDRLKPFISALHGFKRASIYSVLDIK